MKRRLAIVTLVILALAVPASLLAQQNSKAEKEIRAFLEKSRQTNLKGGAEAVATFDKLIADDYIRIPSNGAMLNKAGLLEGFKTGNIKVESTELSDIKIRIYGKWAIVTGIDTSTWTLNGERIDAAARWSRVLRKEDGIWKVMLYQSTKLPAKQ
jgi:hypothetical protein